MSQFERLAPFIKEFVYRQGWSDLRQMQDEAIVAVLDGTHDILLAGATASGKTEAAFLPILTALSEAPSSSVGVLYIGPLKALINDQFERLDALLVDAHIPVWPWHGDVSGSVKGRLLKKPSGVMQTTPESLEGFFLYRNNQLKSVFGDLRFVVIDEVHAFMASDRGRQVLCQLGRLERVLGFRPRRVGLSATLGDYGLAERWLSGEAQTPVVTVSDAGEKRRLRLGLEHYVLPEPTETPTEEEIGFRNDLYRLTKGRKSLVFATSRAMVEEIGASLRASAERLGSPDIYHVHHGSISARLRLAAEEAMREPDKPACTMATVTLELGIDLGQLERVVQVGAGPSVSSLIQRLGRTGRRGEPGEMFLLTTENKQGAKADITKRIPWDLLKTLAQMQLYIEERWVEPTYPPRLPASLLYHQTMSTLVQYGELAPTSLAELVLTLAPFREVGQERFKALLRHLLEIDHLEWTETRTLLIGLAGEKLVNNWRFLATFEDSTEYAVLNGTDSIGTLAPPPPPVDYVLRLAGRTWRVLSIDESNRVVMVDRAKGKAHANWSGSVGDVHDRVVQRMRRLLSEDDDFTYLRPRARQRLAEARAFARTSGLLESILHEEAAGTLVLPWAGSATLRALSLLAMTSYGTNLVSASTGDLYFSVKGSKGEVRRALQAGAAEVQVERLLRDTPDMIPRRGKYDCYVPNELLLESYLGDGMDLGAAITLANQL